MSKALDMSLDDIIKINKKPNRPSTTFRPTSRPRPPRGSGSGPGPFPRSTRFGIRPAPHQMKRAAASDYGVYSDQLAPRVPKMDSGAKLYISNLDYGVSNEDIKELFSEVGDLTRYSVHYDRSGRSKGTADIVFSRKEHALAAFKRYNNVQLDGKPMKIEIVTTVENPVALPPVVNGVFGNRNGIWRGGPGRGVSVGRARGGGRGQWRGRGRGRGSRGDTISATDLDADLEKYHSAHTEAMQIN